MAESGALRLHEPVQPDSGERGNMFPLVCEATVAQQTVSSPSYQGCRTGTGSGAAWAAGSALVHQYEIA